MLPSEARQALQCWLEYAERQRTLTAQLFTARQDAHVIRQLLDENEQQLDRLLDVTRSLLEGDARR